MGKSRQFSIEPSLSKTDVTLTQEQRFEQAIRELGCYEIKTHLEENPKNVTAHKPLSEPKVELKKTKTNKPGE